MLNIGGRKRNAGVTGLSNARALQLKQRQGTMLLRFTDFYAFSRRFEFSWLRFGPLAGLNVAVLAFEAFAVIMLMPIMLFIERRGDTLAMRQESRGVDALFTAFDWIGVAPSFANLLLIAFTATVLRQIVTYRRLIENTRMLEGLLRDVRHGMFRRFNAAQLEFQERTKVGEFVNVVVVEARRTVIGITAFIELSVLIVMLLVYVGMLVTISPQLTSLVVALMLATGISMRGLMRRTVAESRNVTTSNTAMLGFLNERLTAPRLIRLCGMEEVESNDFLGFLRRQVDTQLAVRRMTGIGEVVVEPVIAGAGFLLIFIAYEILSMPLATISVFLFILLRLLPLVKGVITVRQGILAGIGSLEVSDRVMQKFEQAKEGEGGPREFKTIHNEIYIDGVSYSYPESPRPALHNVTLRVKRGTITALVGPSGGGKSTLIDLLPRLRVPQTGTITIDDIPLNAFNIHSLRRGIAFAPQSPQIFDATIEQHIRYGRADANADQIRRAASLAGVTNFVSQLPNGYETRLGQAAFQLSGGQKQRIDLARVLASEAPLLIFDEPTSNLDNESEAAFRGALKTLRQAGDTTIIVIAHRLGLVNWADQIVVLNHGRIEANGTHDEMLAASQWYHDAYLREIESAATTVRAMTKSLA
jgi:ABC-type multidrug transport system fused ATPase/permease subunit